MGQIKAEKSGVVKNQGPAPDTIKQAEKRAKRDAKNAARKTIFAFIAENSDLPIIDEIKLLLKTPGQRGRKASGILDALRAAFAGEGSTGSMTEMAVFKKFHIGRPEMSHNIRKLILTENPADRVWISFDETKESYNVAGIGEDAPDGWTGYIPAKKEAL